MAQGRDGELVGTWRLVSVSVDHADGRVDAAPFGESPSGRLIYTRDGTMAALVGYGGRGRLSADRLTAPAAERAEAFATFFAYAGRYAFDGAEVTHRVDVASVENWVGTDLARVVELAGDRLTLRTPPLVLGGDTRVTELRWERIRDADASG